MNTSEWLIPILTAIIGGIIGTYLGSWFISKRQESKMVKVRKIAIKALRIIKEYIDKKQSIRNSENEFNNKLSIPEKRAIIVALHKLGIAVDVAANETFDINKICFVDKNLDIKTIEDISKQIEDGYCDNLFYGDPEIQFSTNSLFTLRNVAKRYVTEVVAKSTLQKDKSILHISEWHKLFSIGELKSIMVFRDQMADELIYENNEKPKREMIESLQKDIDLGLFDSYLMWNYDMYLNVKGQNSLVQRINTTNPIKK